jgi:hypothetical protein
MIRSMNHTNLIASGQIALDNYSQIGPGPQRLRKAARKHLVAHPDSKAPARHARFRYFKNSGSNLPAFSDERVIHVDSFRREVFAKPAVLERQSEMLFPPLYVFHGVSVDRFIGTPVGFAIRLLVAFKIYTSGSHTTGDR